MIPRVATEAFELAGHRVPKNAIVVISPIVNYWMEAWWDRLPLALAPLAD